MRQKIRKGPHFINLSSSGEFEVLCRGLLEEKKVLQGESSELKIFN
jgi:hypothetical protein